MKDKGVEDKKERRNIWRECFRALSVAAVTCLLIFASLAKVKSEDDLYDTNTVVVNNQMLENSAEYEEFLGSIRSPRGFASTDAVNQFALENNLVNDLSNMTDFVSIGELSKMLYNFKTYYPKMPDGFGDKIKKEDIDYSVISDSDDVYEYLKFALENGYLTTEQVSDSTQTITVNEITRIAYAIGMNGLPYYPPSERDIEIAKETLPELQDEGDDCPECRVAKLMFLDSYDLIPYTYKGDYLKDKVMTKQDALNYLITFIDVLEGHGIESDNPNAGCEPCMDAQRRQEREKYNG